MTLFAKIKEHQLIARKAKDSLAATLLTTLIGEVFALAKNDGNREVTDADVVKLVKKFLDGINESIKYMESAKNEEALTMLRGEATILAPYMPQQMDEATLTEVLCESGPNLGKLMSLLKSRYAGEYDGAMASKIAKTVI